MLAITLEYISYNITIYKLYHYNILAINYNMLTITLQYVSNKIKIY